jgi:hypothetical protein
MFDTEVLDAPGGCVIAFVMNDSPNPPRPAVKRLGSIKPDIAEAIQCTQREVITLPKTEKNNYGKYDYVPIDTYYTDVVPIALKHGLRWQCNLSNARLIAEGVLLFDCSVDLYYKDGTVYRGIDVFPIPHQMIGAQTAGSAKSYADKIFMRSFFKVPTGEGDSDQLPSHVGGHTGMGAQRVYTGPIRKASNKVAASASHSRPNRGQTQTGQTQTDIPPWLNDPTDPANIAPAALPDGLPAWVTAPDDPGATFAAPARTDATTRPPRTMDTAHERTQRLVADGLGTKRHVQATLETDLIAAAKAAASPDELNAAWVARRTELRKLETGTQEDRLLYARIKRVFATRKPLLQAEAERKVISLPQRPMAPFRRDRATEQPPS